MSNSIDQLYKSSLVEFHQHPTKAVCPSLCQQGRTPSTAAIYRSRFQVQQCRTPSTATILSTMSNSINCPSWPVLCSVLR